MILRNPCAVIGRSLHAVPLVTTPPSSLKICKVPPPPGSSNSASGLRPTSSPLSTIRGASFVWPDYRYSVNAPASEAGPATIQ